MKELSCITNTMIGQCIRVQNEYELFHSRSIVTISPRCILWTTSISTEIISAFEFPNNLCSYYSERFLILVKILVNPKTSAWNVKTIAPSSHRSIQKQINLQRVHQYWKSIVSVWFKMSSNQFQACSSNYLSNFQSK